MKNISICVELTDSQDSLGRNEIIIFDYKNNQIIGKFRGDIKFLEKINNTSGTLTYTINSSK